MATYAIRFGQYVEVRRSITPPIKRVMEELVDVEGEKVTYKTHHYSWGDMPIPVVTRIKQKKKLKDIIWEGGRFIVAIPYTRWGPAGVRKGLPSLEEGECKRVPKELGRKLLAEETREELLGTVKSTVNINIVLDMLEDDDDD